MLRDLIQRDTQKALPSLAPNFSLTGATGRRLTGRTARTYLQAYGGEEAIDWVSDCIDLYAQTGSNAEYYFAKPRDPGSTDGSTKPEPVQNPPGDLVNLFREPNPYQDYTELFELAIIDFLATGEFMWLKYKPGIDPESSQFGKPLALYRLSPALIDIEFDDKDRPEHYVYTAPGNSGEPLKIKPEHVVHVKRPNPHDQWRGLSIIAGGPRTYDIELAVTEAMANYYENGTRPSGVLESDRSVPPTTWEKIKRQFRQLHTSPAAAGATIMLERGLKWSPMSASANDAEFEKITELSMKRIAKAFKVPLPLLGEVGGSDRQAVKESQRIFDNKIMRPFLNRIQGQITRQLVASWNLEFYIDYEYVMPIEDKLDLAEAKASVPGTLVKEAREQMDLPPLETIEGVKNGKEIDHLVLNLPGEDREDGGHADRPLSSEAGRPPKGENTKTFPQDGSIPDGAAVRKSLSTEDVARELRKSIRVARERLQEVT